MKINITLGTRVSGPNTLVVANKYTSGKHCRIYSDDATNVVYIEDLNSLNGTYVNGQQVVRYMLSVDDEILLGGSNGFKTTLGGVLKMYDEQLKKAAEAEAAGGNGGGKTPEKKIEPEIVECLDMLHKIESDFQKAELDANDKLSSLTMLRIIPTTLNIILTGVAAIFVPRLYVSIVCGVLTIVMLLLIMKWTSKKSRRIKEAQLKMKENLHYSYACPKCRHSLVGRPWVVLSQDRMCPYCRTKFS